MAHFTLILTLFTALPISALSANEILMRFWAQPDYARPTGLDGQPSIETYVFYPGTYHPSATETDQEAIAFETVARILVEELGKQNYQMSQNPQAADYILMINWGQTNPETEVEEVTYSGIDDEDELTIEEVPEHVRRKNAQLLGANKLYNSMSRISLKKQLVEEAILQDRYFINIFALSIDNLKNRSEGEKIKATWESQLSVPVGDRDATAAMHSMAEMGSDYFGQNVRDLTFMEEALKQGVVTIGEVRFLDDEAETKETTEEVSE